MNGRIIYDSPVGLLEIVSDGKALLSVRSVNEAGGEYFHDNIVDAAEKQLREYFCGKRRCFDIPTAPEGTDFCKKVWRALSAVPYGETRSYGDIAAAIDRPSAARAVGNAVGDNPILIMIPCHRVIRSDGNLGGFSAGTEMKKFLLKLENNLF